MKEVLVQTFGTPNMHPKSKPFYDHMFAFNIADNRIWFRNYQVFVVVICRDLTYDVDCI